MKGSNQHDNSMDVSMMARNREKEMEGHRKNIETLQQENQQLKTHIQRLNENMKSLKFKDLQESKLNVTTENYNKEIQNLEDTLQRYMCDNKRLTMEVSRQHDISRNFENSMIQGTVDTEKKLLICQNKNAQLMKELIEYKRKMHELERQQINNGFGEPFNLDESRIAFNPNQSQMKFGSGVKQQAHQNKFGRKPEPDVADLGITKFLNEDLSFIQEQPDFDSKQFNSNVEPNFSKHNQSFSKGRRNNSGENSKVVDLENQLSQVETERDNLELEISNLNNQIQLMRSDLKNKEDTTNEKNLIRKFKIENEEIRKLADSLQKKNMELVQEKNILRLKVDDLERYKVDNPLIDKSNLSMINKTTGFVNEDLSSQQVSNLKFKVKTLEQTNMDLLKELREYKDAQNKSMMSALSGASNIEYTIIKEVYTKLL